MRRAAFLLLGITLGTWTLQQFTDIDRGAEMLGYMLCDAVLIHMLRRQGYIKEAMTGFVYVIAHVAYSLYEILQIEKPFGLVYGYYATLALITILLALFFLWRAPIIQELRDAVVGMGNPSSGRRRASVTSMRDGETG